ncbi:MAG: Fic family protein [Bacilli bacterium]|nr:Fic family protein [Bacilli bacterium]
MDCFDDDVKIYRRYSLEELKRYIDFYKEEHRMGLDFNGLLETCNHYLMQKKWLLTELHKRNTRIYETLDVADMINDYTMNLLKKFFVLDYFNNMFIFLEENFLESYVRNESLLEGVNDLSIHGKNEMLGLEEMYKYIISDEEKSSNGSMLLTDLHEKLFSFFDDGENARSYRREMAYLPFSGVELEEPMYIPRMMRQADRVFDELCRDADTIRNCPVENRTFIVSINGKNTTLINEFLIKLMKYNAELVRIHPFPDGNGRAIRGLVNYLLMRAGLPPVYVKTIERVKYHEAMNKAIVECDYDFLVNFYKNKLCDSIEELIVNPFERAIHQYRKQKKKQEVWEQEGSNLNALFHPEKVHRTHTPVVKPKQDKLMSINDYLLVKEAERDYVSNIKALLKAGKSPVKKTFGTVIKETTEEPKKQEGSNVLRIFRQEDKKSKKTML